MTILQDCLAAIPLDLAVKDYRYEFINHFGLKEYMRFKKGIADSVRKGRLMSWVEVKWNEFKAANPDAPSGFGDIVSSMDNENYPPFRISKLQFFSEPEECFRSREMLKDPDWISEAWKSESFKEDVCYWISRTVGKTGAFNLSEYEMRVLGSALDISQAKGLFEYIREHSERDVSEWKREFHSYFNL